MTHDLNIAMHHVFKRPLLPLLSLNASSIKPCDTISRAKTAGYQLEAARGNFAKFNKDLFRRRKGRLCV